MEKESALWAEAGRLLFGDDWKSGMADALNVRKDFVGQVGRGAREAREGHWTDLLKTLRDRAQGMRQRADSLAAMADRVEQFIATAREIEE
jgi:hypothetical protein